MATDRDWQNSNWSSVRKRVGIVKEGRRGCCDSLRFDSESVDILLVDQLSSLPAYRACISLKFDGLIANMNRHGNRKDQAFEHHYHILTTSKSSKTGKLVLMSTLSAGPNCSTSMTSLTNSLVSLKS